MPLANGGTCSYNGVAFQSLYRSRITTRPIEDEARRATVHVEHTLTVEGFVAQGPTGPTLEQMRRSLTQPGGTLRYNDKGFGTLDVNVPGGSVRDSTWGPHTDVLEWVPLGGEGMAAQVTLVLRTTIPECDTARYEYALAAWNYDITFAIDESGYTSITVAGYIEIPMTRITVNDRRIPDNVDRYREWLETQVPPGFQRGPRSFRASKDKRRLDFSWTDTELPAPLPDGVTKMSATHSVEADRPYVRWQNNMEATVTVARGAPKRQALDAFLLLLGDRMNQLRTRGPAGAEGSFLPGRYRVSEDVFGRTTSFSYSFTYISRAFSVGPFLAASGLWTPVAGTDYQRWRASLQPYGTQGVRGYAGASSQPADDAIIDLCLNGNSAVAIPVRVNTPPTSEGTTPGNTPGGNNPGGRTPGRIDPFDPNRGKKVPVRASWVWYEVTVELIRDARRARRKLLPSQPPRNTNTGPLRDKTGSVPPQLDDSQAIALGPAGSAGGGGGGGGQAFGAGAYDVGEPFPRPGNRDGWPKDSFQSVAAPTYWVLLYGWAVRVGHRIPTPELVSVGGVPVVELDRRVKEQVLSGWGDTVTYYAAWEILYGLPEAPRADVLVPPNPALGFPGAR